MPVLHLPNELSVVSQGLTGAPPLSRSIVTVINPADHSRAVPKPVPVWESVQRHGRLTLL